MFKDCAPFTNCICRVKQMIVDDTHHNDVVMPMCSLIEYNGNDSKISEILCHYWRDEPTLDPNNAIID